MTEARPTFDEVKQGKNRVPDCIYLVRRPEHARGQPFQVSYRVLLPQKVSNLLVVGKSAAGAALRNMVGVFVMGQAGGTAAALSAKRGVLPRQLDIAALQNTLRRDGVRLPKD